MMNVAISLAKQAENGKNGGGKKWTNYLLFNICKGVILGVSENEL